MDVDRTLQASRTLPYSSTDVYTAFSSGDLLAQWWGPEGFTNTFEIFEFAPSGRWKFVMHGPDGTDYFNESVFEALDPGRKVVIRHACPPFFTLTVTLVPVNGGTHLAWDQVFDDAQTAQAVKARVGPANEQNIDRLEQVLRNFTKAL